MNANPPGVDQLEPVNLDTEELEKQLDSFEEPTGQVEATDEPQDPDPDADTPPASPEGHHQTHSVPVATSGVTDN